MVNSKRRAFILTSLLLLTLVGIALVALTLGPAGITVRQSAAILLSGPGRPISEYFTPNQYFIIWNLRFPRVVAAALSGMALAVAGAVFQAVFRNPMADPYVLGISSGAAFGVSLASFLALIGGASAMWNVSMAAAIGSLGAALFVFLVSGGLRRSVNSLLLTGVALNFFLSAVMTLFMYLNRSQLQSIIQWTLGSFSTASWHKVALLALFCMPPTALIFLFIRELDILLLDEGSAQTVGLSLRSTRLILLGLSSLATAAVVSFFGIIGFVGLMVPHIIRLIIGPKHRHLLPATLAGGALMMVASDTIARTIIGVSELPVGVVTSIAGAPLFVIILLNRRRGSYL